MASLALHQTRSFISTFRSWALPGLQSLLELLPPIVLAVPKSKISHSRKSMRSANKGLKDKRNIVNCPACGEPKLAHHACKACYSAIMKRFRMETKRLATETTKRMSGGSWSEVKAPPMIESPKDS
ncbi:uncharacterized protein F5147DRAFT_663846 [Suillus discolor]|uniref:Large ribosomal subunit protein bL32m n=1 Tax=Suillus discolor TaxID=1912936 RepID=A0A9P7K1F1_9AGAM|nr:uncharacterized protein F5147DRAFT_663846 [Suillus discolor]KAG2120966.1 hypothetical protein F5147DRAFT_663846 [Suillus discolor]